MGLSVEEYSKKLVELRHERDRLRNLANKIDKEMDQLEGDSRLADFTVGKYIKVDRADKGGYIEYFRVDKWEKCPRGVNLYGKGFSDTPKATATYLHLSESLRLTWDELELPVEITEEEFIGAYDSRINQMRNYLLDFSNYHQCEDEFALKNAIRDGKVKFSFQDSDMSLFKISRVNAEE